MNFDADEIPKPEVIQFLKFYDYDGDPFRITFRHAIFGFFWQRRPQGRGIDDVTDVGVGSSIKFLKEQCNSDLINVRRKLEKNCKKNPPFKILRIGTRDHYGGYHCSWCFSPEMIRTKMKFAQNDDGPNWINYPEKVTDEYISNMIRKGLWFDGKTVLRRVDQDSINDFAPNAMLKQPQKYREFLVYPGFIKE